MYVSLQCQELGLNPQAKPYLDLKRQARRGFFDEQAYVAATKSNQALAASAVPFFAKLISSLEDDAEEVARQVETQRIMELDRERAAAEKKNAEDAEMRRQAIEEAAKVAKAKEVGNLFY